MTEWSDWDEQMRDNIMYTKDARMFYYRPQRDILEAILRVRMDARNSVQFDHDLAGYPYGHVFAWVTPTWGDKQVPNALIEAAQRRGFVMVHVDEGYARAAYTWHTIPDMGCNEL